MTLEILTLLTIIAGTVIIGLTYFNIKKDNAKHVTNQMNINEAGFEEYHNELNETALDIYKELDDKYREILVIYDLIDKKHNEMKNNFNFNANNNSFNNDFTKTVNDYFGTNSSVGIKSKGRIERQTATTTQTSIKNNLDVFKNTKNDNENYNFSEEDNLAMKLLDEQLKDEKANNKQNKHSDVIELLNKGFSVEQIARELNIGTGEVILVSELLKVKNEQK